MMWGDERGQNEKHTVERSFGYIFPPHFFNNTPTESAHLSSASALCEYQLSTGRSTVHEIHATCCASAFQYVTGLSSTRRCLDVIGTMYQHVDDATCGGCDFVKGAG